MLNSFSLPHTRLALYQLSYIFSPRIVCIFVIWVFECPNVFYIASLGISLNLLVCNYTCSNISSCFPKRHPLKTRLCCFHWLIGQSPKLHSTTNFSIMQSIHFFLFQVSLPFPTPVHIKVRLCLQPIYLLYTSGPFYPSIFLHLPRLYCSCKH